MFEFKTEKIQYTDHLSIDELKEIETLESIDKTLKTLQEDYKVICNKLKSKRISELERQKLEDTKKSIEDSWRFHVERRNNLLEKVYV